jgi:hypothetical protein
MIRIPNPPYSPDLALSDFYFAGYVSHCLRGQSFEAADEHFSSIEALSRGVEKLTLNAVFLEWMERLEQCTATKSDYVEDISKRGIGRTIFIESIVRCHTSGGTPCKSIMTCFNRDRTPFGINKSRIINKSNSPRNFNRLE